MEHVEEKVVAPISAGDRTPIMSAPGLLEPKEEEPITPLGQETMDKNYNGITSIVVKEEEEMEKRMIEDLSQMGGVEMEQIYSDITSITKEEEEVESEALPLNEKQKMQLLTLVQQREAILTSEATDLKAWEEITSRFNASNPDFDPRTPMQLKQNWGHVKRKMKAEDLVPRKRVRLTGGDDPPPSATPSLPQNNSVSFASTQDNPNTSPAASNPSSNILTSSVSSSSTSKQQPRSASKSLKKTRRKSREVMLDKFFQRTKEHHLARLKMAEIQIMSEHTRTDSFHKMSAFIKKLDGALNRSKVVMADLAKNVNELLTVGKDAFQAMALYHNPSATQDQEH